MNDFEQAFFEYRNISNARVAALRAVLMALIDSHPNRGVLSAQMSVIAEHLTGNWLASELPDLFVSEFQREMAELQSRAESA